MGVSVQVYEYTGKLVARCGDVRAVLTAVASDGGRYPLLAGVDDHDDTIFNARQAVVLIAELEQLAAVTDDRNVHELVAQLIGLAELLVAAPRRPHHRRLVFNGD